MGMEDCCRLCLKNLADVLQDEDGHFTVTGNPDLQRMILECFQILVPDDEIISKVCSRCNDQVRVVDKIRKRVKRVDFEIKQYYASLIVKLEDDFNEDVGESDISQIHAQEDTKTGHEQSQEVVDPIPNDNLTNECEYIKVEPLLFTDQDSMESNASESQSDSGSSYKAPVKRPRVKKRPVKKPQAKKPPVKKRKYTKRPKEEPKKEVGFGRIVRKVDSKCYICQTDFDTTEAMDDHISSHVGSVGQVCHLCQEPITTVRHFNMHLRRVHFRKGKLLPCKECKKNDIDIGFSSHYKLEAHLRAEHNKPVEEEKTFVCTFCGKSFNRATNLRLHENIHTKAVLFKCKQCPFTALARSGLHRHERIHTDEKPFKCDECDAAFNQSNGLHSHKAAKHSDERPFSCQICGDEKRFKSKYTLATHMRMHDKADGEQSNIRKPLITAVSANLTVSVIQKELKCDFCPAVYAWEKPLCRHIAEKHPEENVPMLSCESCQEENKSSYFLTQKELDRHMAKHKISTRPPKERKCPDCGEVYLTSESYQKHRQTHIKYVCDECGKTLSCRKSLRLHVLSVHLKSRPYKCDKCDSSFSQFTSLTSHMKIHDNPSERTKRRLQQSDANIASFE